MPRVNAAGGAVSRSAAVPPVPAYARSEVPAYNAARPWDTGVSRRGPRGGWWRERQAERLSWQEGEQP
jgi:hypothetical protein